MTGFMLPALQGECVEAFDSNSRGSITVTSLYGYVVSKMPKEQQPRLFGAVGPLVLVTNPERAEQLQRESRRDEREQKLRAMLTDHSAFMQSRLNSFQGRTKELVVLHQRIIERLQTGGYVTITGRAGQGKSSIIAKLIEDAGKEQGLDRIAFHFIPLNPGRDHQFGLLRNLMARLILKYGLSDLYVDGQSTAALRDYFPKVLKEVTEKDGQEVIFIDGLDQLEEDSVGEGMKGKRDLSFLPPDVPPGIVFVLGTRPNDTLRPLELLKPHGEYPLPNLSRYDFDLILQHHGVALERHVADRFYRVLDENALFLDLVARELQERTKQGSISAAEVEDIIKQITNNPENLFALAIERLSRRETLWEGVIKPLLGVLMVANEPLERMHLKQIINLNQATPIDGDQLNQALERLGGLVISNTQAGQQRYTLFHLKLRDYLRQDVSRQDKHYVFDTEDEQHLQLWLVAWCEQGDLSRIWEDAQHDSTERGRCAYARQHYIAHLYYAQAWQRLFEMLDEGNYGKAKVQYDPSTRTYVLDLDWGRQAAASEHWSLGEGIQHLSHLWRYTLLRCSLASRADQYPKEAFQLMVLLGDETKALGLAELITDPVRRAAILLLFAQHLMKQIGREAEGRQMLMRVYEVTSRIKDLGKEARALSELGRALAQAQQWSEAERVINTIKDREQRAEALSELGRALMRTQQWAAAERVIGTIKEDWRQAEALSELGRVLAQGQQVEEARRIWQEAERVISTIKEGRQQRARALSELGRVLAQGQQVEEARRIWQEAERVISTIKEGRRQAEALSELGRVLAQAQQWSEAERVINTIKESWQHRAWALNELGRALAQGQQAEEARRIWQEAERVIGTIKEGRQQRARALSELGRVLAQTQRWKGAERVINTIKDREWRAEALSELGRALMRTQQWAAAKRVIGMLEDWQMRAEALSELGRALAQGQQAEEARRIWQEAERVIGMLEEDWQRARALSELGRALAQGQQVQEARRIWQEAERVIGTIKEGWQQRAEALNELGRALAKAQQWSEAERVINTIKDREQRAEALSELGRALAQAQQWSEAERVINTIKEDWQRAEALSELGRALAQGQQAEEARRIWQEAERVIDTIKDRNRQARALSELVDALTTSGKYEQLLHLIRRLWLSVEQRDEAIPLLPLAYGFIPCYLELGRTFGDAFTWVDEFLRG
jgi:tetratricopeptide (TPR) repeat protein